MKTIRFVWPSLIFNLGYCVPHPNYGFCELHGISSQRDLVVHKHYKLLHASAMLTSRPRGLYVTTHWRTHRGGGSEQWRRNEFESGRGPPLFWL